MPLDPRSDPLGNGALSAYSTWVVVGAGSTMAVAVSPYTRFLLTDALLVPVLLLAVGLWAPLVGRFVAGRAAPPSFADSVFAATGASMVVGLLASVLVLVGFTDWGLRSALPALVGWAAGTAILLGSVRFSNGGMGGRGDKPGEPGRNRYRGRTGSGLLGLEAVAIFVLSGGLGMLAAYLFAGAPTGGSLGFVPVVAQGGFLFAAVGLAGALGVLAWAYGAGSIERRIVPYRGPGPTDTSGGPSGPGRLSRSGWEEALAAGAPAVGALVGAAVLLLAFATMGPAHGGVSPAVAALELGLSNALFVLGLAVGIAGAVLPILLTVELADRSDSGDSDGPPRRAGTSAAGGVVRVVVVCLVLPVVIGVAFGVVGLAGFVVGVAVVAIPMAIFTGTSARFAGRVASRAGEPSPEEEPLYRSPVAADLADLAHFLVEDLQRRTGLEFGFPMLVQGVAAVSLLIGAGLLRSSFLGFP